MSLGDRFFTPQTAKAILSWRLLLGAGAGVLVGLLLGPIGGVMAGLVTYAGAVLLAMPRRPATVRIDAFTLGEPWRQFVQQGERARRRLDDTVRSTADGPLRQRLAEVAAELDHGLHEAFAIARRGDQIDAAVTRLDPLALRSRLAHLERQASAQPGRDHAAAIASVRQQIESAERLKAQSRETADRLRLTSTRLDELVARAAEVSVGTSAPDTYAADVDRLVIDLEALHQAVEEMRATGTDSPGPA